MSERASDDEIAALQPIIADLVEMLDPHVIARAYRRAHVAGAMTRVLVVPECDVDVIRLARYVRARCGDVKLIEASRLSPASSEVPSEAQS